MSERILSLHGRRHRGLLTWLQETWLAKGPPVCIVQGFPGVGKTRVARDFVAALTVPRAFIEIPDGEGVSLDSVLLDAAGELKEKGRPEIATAIDRGTPLDQALTDAMRGDMVLVIDEVQRAFHDSGDGPFERLLQRLARQPGRGRILLLTSRRIDDRERWTEHLRVEPPLLLDPHEARALLDTLLADKERDADIPIEERDDVVRWLGSNPRAMRVLVAGLADDALRDLIGLKPEAWEVRDREVSPELLRDLERQLLARALSRTEAPVRALLRNLAVFRKPFDRHAVDAQR